MISMFVYFFASLSIAPMDNLPFFLSIIENLCIIIYYLCELRGLFISVKKKQGQIVHKAAIERGDKIRQIDKQRIKEIAFNIGKHNNTLKKSK